MTIKWYVLAEMLGLVKKISGEYNDGSVHWSVAANTGEIFFTLHLMLIPVLFFVGYLIHFVYRAKQMPDKGEKMVLIATMIVLAYAVSLAVGIGPYIQFYPQGGGFLDLHALEHMADGIYVGVLALMVFLGGKTDRWMSKNKEKNFLTK